MISEFKGEYRWLSNFWRVNVEFEGQHYPSVEYAYQAAKTLIPEERELIAMMPTAGQAKRAGRTVILRKDWVDVRISIMRDLLRLKFRDPGLRQKLIETGDELLAEGNYWHDTFWGFCHCKNCGGKGSNLLGILLMQMRDEAMLELQ